mgnify:FL=1
MYYLNIYKSEKDGSIMLPFNNDIESLIEYVVDQYERMMRHLKSDHNKYQKITSTWDKNIYDEPLKESIKNFSFGIFQSMNISIVYELTPEYNEKMHSEKVEREETIHWEIVRKYPLKEKRILDLMLRPDYDFVCVFTKEMALKEGIHSHTARLWVGDIGVARGFKSLFLRSSA